VREEWHSDDRTEREDWIELEASIEPKDWLVPADWPEQAGLAQQVALAVPMPHQSATQPQSTQFPTAAKIRELRLTWPLMLSGGTNLPY